MRVVLSSARTVWLGRVLVAMSASFRESRWILLVGGGLVEGGHVGAEVAGGDVVEAVLA